jgi:hypothetical protein
MGCPEPPSAPPNGDPDDRRKEKKGMKIRLALQCCMAGLALCSFVAVPDAFGQDLQKAMTYDDYMALPKLEVVTEEVRGTFATAKIEYVSFKEVEGIDRYQMTGTTAKGRATGIQPLVQDYRKVRLEAKSLMVKLCGKKKAVVESDLLYLEHFTTQFRCQ